jgi:23S rRNA pseudouridine2605 synthase
VHGLLPLQQRLQKIIAAAGVTSRRKAEELITSGRVMVNGQIVSELGEKADPISDHIRVDGKLLTAPERKVYVMVNKPKGYITSVSDPEGRPTVMNLVPGLGARVYPIGRLDWSSEGLLLMTNDGELANALTRAASHVPKVYQVKISGRPNEQAISKLRTGVTIVEDGRKPRSVKTAPAKITLLRDAPNPWYEMTLAQGRNRQIHRMFEKIGHHVEKIKRVAYGPLKLDIEPGAFRMLTAAEVAALRRASARGQANSPRKYTDLHGSKPEKRTHPNQKQSSVR